MRRTPKFCRRRNGPKIYRQGGTRGGVFLAGQRAGLKGLDDAIWLVSFMTYNLGYFDLDQRTLQPLDNPSGTRLLPMP
jgi:hypothetical protein